MASATRTDPATNPGWPGLASTGGSALTVLVGALGAIGAGAWLVRGRR